MNIYEALRKLAKSVKAQNLFNSAKEIHGVRLFRNDCDLSKLQSDYISFLYFYDTIARDIIVEKISKHVHDCELYEDAYYLYKNEKGNKKEDKNNGPKDLKLVMGTKIIFPKTEEKTNG